METGHRRSRWLERGEGEPVVLLHRLIGRDGSLGKHAGKRPGSSCAPLTAYAVLIERYFRPQRWAAGPGLDR
jgi:hypothetical protein